MPISDFEEPRWINSWTSANPSTDTIAFCGNTKDFSPLANFPNLRHLLVRAAYQEQLALIGTLARLERLEIRWLWSVTDFERRGKDQQTRCRIPATARKVRAKDASIME